MQYKNGDKCPNCAGALEVQEKSLLGLDTDKDGKAHCESCESVFEVQQDVVANTPVIARPAETPAVTPAVAATTVPATPEVQASYTPTVTPDMKVVAKSINKHLFVWVLSICFGVLGVDRFMRGQIVTGLLKLCTGGVWGILWLVDVLIALSKAYGNSYGRLNDLTFDRKGNYIL
jgi:TM2 domain-containing membrane protein YozV